MKARIGVLLALFVCFGMGMANGQTRIVTGSVTDALTGEPVVGAEVSVAGQAIRAIVQDNGAFSIGVPAGPVTVRIRRIGYRAFEAVVPANQNTLNVTLAADVLQLDEVVVTGTATQIARQNLANAVATVSGEAVTQVSSESVEHALQGKVVGADIQVNSYAPGGGAQVRLRGVTSINATASPLYVIDGVIVSDAAIPSNQNAVTASTGGNNPALTQDGQVNRIADLNPNDIESVEVLKGASASAIYGSKASNGVIIITTKRGRAGRPQVNVSQRFGIFDLANKLGSRTFEDAAELDAQFGAGTAAAVGFTPGVAFDLEQELAGRNDLSTETAFSVTGGANDTRYFLSGLWKNDAGVMENTGFAKHSIRANVDQAFGDRLNASVSTNFTHTDARRGLQNNDNAGVSPYMVFPFTANVVDLKRRADGTFPDNPFERSNPLQTLGLMKNDENVWRFIGSGRLDLAAVQTQQQQLNLIGVAGIDFFQQQNELFFPPELQFEDDDGFPGTSLLTNSDNVNITLNGSAVYTYSPGGGGTRFTTSTGVQYETRDLNIARVTSRGLTAGQPNIDAGTNVTVNEIRQRVEDFGFYVQEEVLMLNDRLLLTAGFRADQSSANADDTKLYFFPKLAGSYRFPDLGGVVNDLKIRVAYGESGNQPLFGQKFTPLDATNNIEGIAGITIPGNVLAANVGSKELKPERQREIEGGVDATLFNDRATLEFTVYQKTITDLLLTRALAPSSGFSQEIFNGGKLRTRGVELGVGLIPVQSPGFSWVFRSNFFLNRSNVTELPVPSFLPASSGFGVGLGTIRIEQGKSATQFVGNIRIDPVSGAPVDSTIGDVNPDFKVAFTNDINWKALRLYFHWDWQQGGTIVNLTRLLYDAGGLTKDFDVPAPGETQGAGLKRLLEGPLVGGDTRIYAEDATFLKLREITLSYALPQSAVRGIWGGIRNARLSVSARNLLTFTDYSGMDPEVSNFGNQPTGRNIDVAPFPRTRSFWFGIDLGF